MNALPLTDLIPLVPSFQSTKRLPTVAMLSLPSPPTRTSRARRRLSSLTARVSSSHQTLSCLASDLCTLELNGRPVIVEYGKSEEEAAADREARIEKRKEARKARDAKKKAETAVASATEGEAQAAEGQQEGEAKEVAPKAKKSRARVCLNLLVTFSICLLTMPCRSPSDVSPERVMTKLTRTRKMPPRLGLMRRVVTRLVRLLRRTRLPSPGNPGSPE